MAHWTCFWAADEKVASAQRALEACGASGVSGVSEVTLQGGLQFVCFFFLSQFKFYFQIIEDLMQV